MKIKRSKNPETDEWGTPQWLFNILNLEFDFTCDVAATDQNHKCTTWFTKERCGLQNKWGIRNWCNPPYSKQLPWIAKANDQLSLCHKETVLLLKYDPSTAHGRLIVQTADEIRIIQHRLTFEGAPNCANFPSCLAIYRKRHYTRRSDAIITYADYRGLIK